MKTKGSKKVPDCATANKIAFHLNANDSMYLVTLIYDLDLGPMTLVLDRDLDILKVYLRKVRIKNEVSR